MNDTSAKSETKSDYAQQLREMNEALLVSSLRQHELTEQAQEAEAALRDSQEHLRRNAETFSKLVDQSPFGIYIVDSDFRIAQVSAGAQPAFRNVRPLIGRDFGEAIRIIWSEPFAGEVIDIFRHTLETGEPYVAPSLTEQRRDIDEVESYEWQTHRVTLPDGRYGVVCHFFDATRLRQAERAADEANRSKDMFLATLSHEMRTPLSAIVGWMHILRGGTESGCGDADLNEGLDAIDRNSQAMVQLLNDVLDVSRIVSGKLRLEVRPCELDKIVRAGIDVVRPAAQAKDITLRAELDPAASAASCDAARMQQVVWNLVSNAVKFTPKGGTVRVTLDRTQSDLRIQVSDSGQGIAPDLLPYVFDRFRQADSSTRRHFGGLGLGLSIAKHLVELHGGTIQVESAGEGQGATFTVLLPIRAVRIDESGDEPAADEFEQFTNANLPVVRLDDLRVLVVDDEPDARRLLVKVLQQAGAVVTAAASAAEAIDALPKANPQVLVSDLGMPDEDGFDLIRQIRADGHLAKDLPAVALTAFVRKQDRRQALLAGFQMHVPKPVDPHDLTAAIAALAGPA